MNDPGPAPAIRYYFVDEAGDPILFNRKKRVVVGNAGCSEFFIVGKADIENPTEVARELEELRMRLLADPYFKGVPSMQPDEKKTALAFHAKDDLPEIRREVFQWLAGQPVRFFAVVRDKRVITRKVLEHNKNKPTYRYNTNQLYDRCVSQLFKERLHKHDGYRIYFARRGSSDRTSALRNAIEAARESFYARWGIMGAAPIEILASDPKAVPCLQITDYFLWALQRLYERGEDRFLNLLASKVGLIHDVDDVTGSPAGAYYTQSHPLNAATRAKK